MRAVFRNKCLLDDDVVAAGRSKAGGVPGVDDLGVGAR